MKIRIIINQEEDFDFDDLGIGKEEWEEKDDQEKEDFIYKWVNDNRIVDPIYEEIDE